MRLVNGGEWHEKVVVMDVVVVLVEGRRWVFVVVEEVQAAERGR